MGSDVASSPELEDALLRGQVEGLHAFVLQQHREPSDSVPSRLVLAETSGSKAGGISDSSSTYGGSLGG